MVNQSTIGKRERGKWNRGFFYRNRMEPYSISSHDWYESNWSRDRMELETDITQRKGGSTSGGKAEEKWRKSGDVGLMGRVVMVVTKTDLTPTLLSEKRPLLHTTLPGKP